MTEPQKFDDEFREVIREASTSPVRWERVVVLARRRAFAALLSLILLGTALIVLLSLGAFAGKSALDPSFSPPLLSRASAEVDMASPRLGWGLFETGLTGSDGYLMRTDLQVKGLKNTKLVVEWSVRSAGETEHSGDRQPIVERRFQRILPRSNSEHRVIEQWIPRAQRTGLYKVEVVLRSVEGRVFDQDQSGPIYFVGLDCCRRYMTPMYASLLPRGWHLAEDFAPDAEERFVTVALGPAENSLVIDTSLIDPENEGGNPLEKARELERLLASNGDGYQRLRWRQYKLRGNLTLEWSYRLEGDAFTDIFFYRGPSGFAVLGRSAPAHFRETRDLTRLIAKSIDPRP